MIVLDSGAIIAPLKAETGASTMRQLLRVHSGNIFIHAVNLLEIYYGFERDKGAAYSERILTIIDKIGIQTRNDLDRNFIRDASHLKISHKMSLADSFAVALARRVNGPLVSTDHHEPDPVDKTGVCRVIFIR